MKKIEDAEKVEKVEKKEIALFPGTFTTEDMNKLVEKVNEIIAVLNSVL